jgi:hypothetical protein
MNVQLDETTTIMNTNRRGEAFFGLRFISGIPGVYNLAFQAGSVRSQNTNTFTLANPILNVTYITQPQATIYGNI